MTSLAIMGLLPPNAKVTGSIRLRGQRAGRAARTREMREIRGKRGRHGLPGRADRAQPGACTVGDQLVEAVARAPSAAPTGRTEAARRARDRAARARRHPVAANARRPYPHEFSGGMRQRVMIAMSIANEPSLLIADEPTTALDVTVQAQVLEVLRTVQERTGTTVMLITHDLGVVAGTADRVLVMYAGGMVEEAPVDGSSTRPRTPTRRACWRRCRALDRRSAATSGCYQIAGQPPARDRAAAGLPLRPRCAHVPRGDPCAVSVPAAAVGRCRAHVAACHSRRRAGRRSGMTLEHSRSTDLVKEYPIRGGRARPHGRRGAGGVGRQPRDRPAATFGLVGETGCGKSTLGRSVVRLRRADAGAIRLGDDDITARCEAAAARRTTSHPARVPGPLRLAQPAA